MRKKDLVESIQATFKDGTTKVFNTIQEAAEETGLTEASIKMRCSRANAGSKSKDGITFIWADERTRKAKMAKKSKNKGNAFELEVIRKLKEAGYEGCVSARSESKSTDDNKIDIVDTNGELPINVQCKYTINTPNYYGIRAECTDKSKPFVLIWKKASADGADSPGTLAMIPVDYLYQLLKK